MSRLLREDGVEIHWEERGEGPLVVLGSYWSLHSSVFDPITEELARDHRVVRYDDRGIGRSTRSGPYDLDTATSDLEAVIEAADGRAVVLCIADGSHRAVRSAARRPDLFDAIVSLGGPPIGRGAFADSEVLVSSETVVNALVDLAETDYRAALRTIVTATNPQMSEDELRERVRVQAEYSPAEAAVPRLRAWAEADSTHEARAIGPRLWILHSPVMAGEWFPSGRELATLIETTLPEAQAEEIEDGIVSRPDLTAAVIRRITARARAGAR